MNSAREQFVHQAAALLPGTPEANALSPAPGSLIPQARQAGLNDSQINRLAAQTLGLPYAASLAEYPTSAAFVAHIPIAFARRHQVLGLSGPDERMLIALGDLGSWQQLDVLARLLQRPLEPLITSPAAVTAAINEAYQQRSGQAQAVIDTMDRGQVLQELQQLAGREDLLDVASRAPVIKLVNLMLFDAVKIGASDVHIQPYEEKLVVRLRLDGMLYDSFQLPKSVQEEVLSRVKVMGRMNIAEKRLAQDGRATVQVGDRCIDLRIASLPTSVGERIVIRLLDKSARLYRLGELGMPPAIHGRFRKLIGLEHGLILVTGPTGSGKSTTLYAALKEIDCRQHNVLTLEDPIEYQLEGISQTQVSDKKGMTFAGGLRHVLRQDPDIIMVGEIRDRETATMAIQSALTGHLVFSTLHTNDAASALTRLLDLGIEPYLAASSVVGVLAQRLVRMLCPACKEAYEPSADELDQASITPAVLARAGNPRHLYRAVGCPLCQRTGYSGRTGIYELMLVDDDIRQLILKNVDSGTIKARAVAGGMMTLLEHGAYKVAKGETTGAEVLSVTAEDI